MSLVKEAFLASLYTKKTGGRLSKAVTKKLETRIKNTPGVEFSHDSARGLLKKVWSGVRSKDPSVGNRLAHASMLPASAVSISDTNSIHVLPSHSKMLKVLSRSKDKGVSSVGKAMQSRQARAAVGHHELDELKSPTRGAMFYGPQHTGRRIGANAVDNDKYRKVAKAIKRRDLRGFVSSAREAAPDVVRDVKTLSKASKLRSAQHHGADVIVNESNRVFHEMSPSAAKHMKAMREGSESALLKKHGLRYGDEYVQPGTRRYNKLVRKVNEAVAKGDAPDIKGKIVRIDHGD